MADESGSGILAAAEAVRAVVLAPQATRYGWAHHDGTECGEPAWCGRPDHVRTPVLPVSA